MYIEIAVMALAGLGLYLIIKSRKKKSGNSDGGNGGPKNPPRDHDTFPH